MGRVVERKTAFVGSPRTSRVTLIVGGVVTIALGAIAGLGISMYADRSDSEQRVVAVAGDAGPGDAQPVAGDGQPVTVAGDAQLAVMDAGSVMDASPVAGDAQAPVAIKDAGTSEPAKPVDLPAACREFRAALEKLTECRQLPSTSRDGIKTALGKLDARWAALGPLTDATKRELAEKCTQDMGSIKKSRALCAGGGGGGGGSSPW
jgi:hypothetical protein